MTDCWKISLPCSRTEAEAVPGDALLRPGEDSAPTIVTREASADQPDDWVIDIYCETEPDNALLSEMRSWSPSAIAANRQPVVEKLGDEDWVAMSQQGLEPLRAGRFYVHTSDSAPSAETGIRNIEINAGQAFGTGHHETTLGCLETLDRLKRTGGQFRNIADIGTGTGLLAIAARHLWPTARILASDIDPVAVSVSIANAQANALRTGLMPHAIEMITSNGLDHRHIQKRAPFDLIIANILAGPLVALAPQLAAAAAPGTVLILAGLLERQQSDVLHAYVRLGFRLRKLYCAQEWPCLTLVKAQHYGPKRTAMIGKSPLAADYFGEC